MLENNTPIDVIEIVITIIVSGGIVAGFFEWIRNLLAQRREEYMDISKIKIDFISKALPYYNQLAYYYNTLENYLNDSIETNDSYKNHLRFSRLYLYYICNILYLKDEIFKNFGSIQLDNVEAEKILQEFGNEFERIIRRNLGFVNISIMRNDLIKKNDKILPYHQFAKNLQRNSNLYSYFKNKIIYNEKVLIELKRICHIYEKLLVFEINHNFNIWYGEDQNFQNLEKDILEYLKKEHSLYYDRIRSFNKRKLSEPSTWISGSKIEKHQMKKK